MMRQANATRSLLLRVQARRQKHEAHEATCDAAAQIEHCAIGLMSDALDRMPAPPRPSASNRAPNRQSPPTPEPASAPAADRMPAREPARAPDPPRLAAPEPAAAHQPTPIAAEPAPNSPAAPRQHADPAPLHRAARQPEAASALSRPLADAA